MEEEAGKLNNEIINHKKSLENNQFKALVYAGMFVNANMLNNGVYISEIPFIYSEAQTIESLCSMAKTINEMNGKILFSEDYFDNLRSCELVCVTINISE